MGDGFLKTVDDCGVTGDFGLRTLWDLPKFPLTESFGQYSPDFETFPQELVISTTSGHVQLRHQLNPSFLYGQSTYSYKTGSSAKIKRELDFLVEFIGELTSAWPPDHVFEFGANDLTLAKRLSQFANQVTVCDPLLPEQIEDVPRNLHCIRKTVEESLSDLQFENIDLVIARHTLEHIPQPIDLLLKLQEFTSRNCVFIFEVPSLDHLVKSLRFDSIIHQHLHYFDLDSVHSLAKSCGMHVVSHTYNDQGSNGGSLLFALAWGSNQQIYYQKSVDRKTELIFNAISDFERHMDRNRDLISSATQPIFGFGAALMLATLDYHLGGVLENLECVLDDDPLKHGIKYRNVNVEVTGTSFFTPPPDSIFFITSLENIDSIKHRIEIYIPRQIIVPVFKQQSV